MIAKKLFILVLVFFVQEGWTISKSIQRGSDYFFTYCSACHSLKYAPSDLWHKQLRAQEPWRSFLYHGPWQTRLNQEDAKNWFGRVPPDLSLVAQQHSKSWIIKYLNGFYQDPKHPLGRNNFMLQQVAMPDILYTTDESREAIVSDIADFLDYVSYPEAKIRNRIGFGVMGLCFLALCVTWFLKKIYKD